MKTNIELVKRIADIKKSGILKDAKIASILRRENYQSARGLKITAYIVKNITNTNAYKSYLGELENKELHNIRTNSTPVEKDLNIVGIKSKSCGKIDWINIPNLLDNNDAVSLSTHLLMRIDSLTRDEKIDLINIILKKQE